MWANFFRSVINHAFDKKTNGQTDGRTDRLIVTRPPCIQCSAVKRENLKFSYSCKNIVHAYHHYSRQICTGFKIVVLVYKAMHDLAENIVNLCLSLNADNCVRRTSTRA